MKSLYMKFQRFSTWTDDEENCNKDLEHEESLF